MDLVFDDAFDLAERISCGSLDPRDLMAASYDQIERCNGALNALISLLPREEALKRAASAPSGPLSGLPIAIKDLANARGFPSSMGSPLMDGQGAAKADDLFVKRLRDAGAVIIGKTNTPEFGLGSHTYNPVHGTTRNAWDLSKSAGGSSGGATVALATGMVPIADGSDMMGSLRNPAGWSNTYGLRPSWGLVPAEPSGDTFLHQLATEGPMGRSPRDVDMLLRVMAGPDRRQPHGVALALPLALSQEPRRLGWLGDWGGAYATEAGLLETCEAAIAAFEPLGCSVEPLDAPFVSDALWEAWTTLRSWQVASKLAPVMERPDKAALLRPEARWEVERGLGLSAMDVHRASVIRSDWYAKAQTLFETYDALLMPTAQVWPFPAQWDWPKEVAGQEMDTYHRWMEITVPVNLVGLPSLAMPAGFGPAGLPIGLQLIGPRGSDLGLLALAQRWHDSVAWTKARPAIARP